LSSVEVLVFDPEEEDERCVVAGLAEEEREVVVDRVTWELVLRCSPR